MTQLSSSATTNLKVQSNKHTHNASPATTSYYIQFGLHPIEFRQQSPEIDSSESRTPSIRGSTIFSGRTICQILLLRTTTTQHQISTQSFKIYKSCHYMPIQTWAIIHQDAQCVANRTNKCSKKLLPATYFAELNQAKPWETTTSNAELSWLAYSAAQWLLTPRSVAGCHLWRRNIPHQYYQCNPRNSRKHSTCISRLKVSFSRNSTICDIKRTIPISWRQEPWKTNFSSNRLERRNGNRGGEQKLSKRPVDKNTKTVFRTLKPSPRNLVETMSQIFSC